MRPDRGGLILSGIYTAIFIFLIALSFFSQNAKGSAVFAQLALFPAMILVTLSGLEKLLDYDSWLNNIVVFFLLSVAIVYLIGWAVHAAIRLARARLSRPK